MRRIDAIAISVAFFALGGSAFWALKVYGFSSENAGIWSQVVLVAVILGWVSTYVYRAVTQTMTLNQQLDTYKTEVLKKQLAEMSPADLAKLQAEVDAESKS